MDKRGVDYLRKKLENHSVRVNRRYKEYDMKYHALERGIALPPELRMQYQATIGWCSKAVDALADRLVFRHFQDDILNTDEIFKMNSPDILFDSAILNALIASCSFIYISEGDEDAPRLQVIEANKATGIIDPITHLLTEGYAILQTDENGKPTVEAYFEPYRTSILENGKVVQVLNHSAPYPLLVPIIHRSDAVRPFGRSRITRAAMYYQQYAKRTLERSDVTAEFYSFPQKYILGMDSQALAWDTWTATISSMLRIDKDADGDRPTVGQFTTSSMSPFTEQLRTAAAGFAGETGLTLDDLGFVSDNPSSSEAIKASHETLRAMARKAQRGFSTGFINTAYLAVCVRDNMPYLRSQFMNLEAKWEPVFEADASTIALVGDGLIKLNQAIPGYANAETVRDLTGLKGAGQ